MPQRRHQRLFVLMILLSLLCAACSVVPKAKLTYKPPFAPIRFTIDTRGHISVEWDRAMELVTFLGEFSVKGSVDIAKEKADGLKVVIHDGRKPADKADSVYLIASNDELDVVIDGRTRVTVGRDRVVVDVTDGTVRTIEVRPPGASPASVPPAGTTPPAPKPSPRRPTRAPTPRPPLPVVMPEVPDLEVTYHCACYGPRDQESWKVLLNIRNRTSRDLPIGARGATPLRLLVADVSGRWTPPRDVGSRPVEVHMPDGTRATAIPPNAPQAYESLDGQRTFATIWRQPASLAPGGATDCSFRDTSAGPRSRCDLVFYVPTGARTRVLGIGYVDVSRAPHGLVVWLPFDRWGDQRGPRDF